MHCLLAISIIISALCWAKAESYYNGQMPTAFSISPRAAGPDTWGNFQPILVSPNGTFAMGFIKIQENSFLLSIICLVGINQSTSGKNRVPDMVWTANRNNYISIDADFIHLPNKSLALQQDHGSDFLWCTDSGGEELVLLDTGNLQLIDKNRTVWQSFDHPTDTLLQGQNFTGSMKLISSTSVTNTSEGPYFLQLQATAIALYARFGNAMSQVYWKRDAQQAKALIVPGKGNIYARLEPNGYLAMYQTESALVDVLPLNTYHQTVRIRRLKIESDGNLRVFYDWKSSSTNWELDFQAIQNACELPSFCGAYGVCSLGNQCTCLGFFNSNFINYSNPNQGCSPSIPADHFCKSGQGGLTVRVEGMDLPFMQFADFVTVGSPTECEDLCRDNCSCAAAFFYNNSKRCYPVQHPLQTLVQVDNKQRVGFVKLVENSTSSFPTKPTSKGSKALLIVGLVLMSLICVLCFCILIAWRARKIVAKEDPALQMSEKFISALS
eukprot:Gb_08824 [translate_table: standard]